MSKLVHVHCCECDWDGMGDPNDACYGCEEQDTLKEINPDDERCIHCGQRGCGGECEDRP